MSIIPFNFPCALLAPVANVVCYCWEGVAYATDWAARNLLHSFFYMGYQVLPSPVVREREQNLKNNFHAHALECTNAQGRDIAVRYLRSQAERTTGNAVVICLNTTYVDHHPKHYIPFLENGADVVLWNPTEVIPCVYQEDLACVLRRLKQLNPEQRIAIKSYCASTDPAIGAAASVNFPVTLIVDRGHGDVFSLARSNTAFAGCGCVTEILREDYDCGGKDKIASLQGRVLLLTPEVDQVMSFGTRNFTQELHKQAPQTVLENIPGDHWAKWGKTAYRTALRFLHQDGILSSIKVPNFPDPHPPTFWDRTIMPWLVKAWC